MMKIPIINFLVCLSLVFCFFSCVGSNANVFTPVPDLSIYETKSLINIENIIENRNIPEWLRVYINGGIEAVERLDAYSNKYVFIAVNEGNNESILNIWSRNISAAHDFPMLAARRIEARIVSASSIYPDDEYGSFFETMIKNAYSGLYPGAVKADTHWIKIRIDSENPWDYMEKYMCFVLMTIDRMPMQAIVRSMISRSNAAVTVTNAQSSAINRLRQNFFEGF